jgi:hypothetical protein
MLPSLVVPSAHRLPGTGAVPGTAGRPPSAPPGAGPRGTGLARMGPSRRVASSAHGTYSRRPTVLCHWTPKLVHPLETAPRAEGKIIDRGPYMDLRHRMDSH